MFKKLRGKLTAAKNDSKCSITIEIQRLEGIPESIKQVKVNWEKDGKLKAASDVCTVHKGEPS